MAGLAGQEAWGGEPEVPQKPKVRLVFSHHRQNAQGRQAEAGWPNLGYDHEGRKEELLANLRQACPGVEFLPATAYDPADAKRILEGDAEVDGYLAYMIGGWAGAAETIAATGRPTIFVGDLFGASGEILTAYAAARRRRWKVAVVSSSRLEDVAEAARCFGLLKKPGGSADAFLAACNEARRKGTKPPGDMRCAEDAVKTVAMDECLKKLKASVILAVGGGWSMPDSGKAIEAVLGPKVVPIEFKELHEACLKADQDAAAKWADTWTKAAEKVIEPKREDIENSGAVYVAMRSLLERHNAQGITINCLGGFYGGHLKAYPCLGFCQLNDDGLVGACEGDLTSTVTMMAVGALTGRPGFISDPVIDTSKNRIIYAHCVAPTRVFGPQGKANPYHLRSHSEDRKGASMRSLMPLGHMTTTLEIDTGRKQMVLHQAKTVENVDDDKACRTKLAAEPKGDIDKLFGEWDQWGWHRVTFYGDLKAPLEDFAKALGLTIIEEA